MYIPKFLIIQKSCIPNSFNFKHFSRLYLPKTRRNPYLVLRLTVPQLFRLRKIINCLQSLFKFVLALPYHVEIHAFILWIVAHTHLEYL